MDLTGRTALLSAAAVAMACPVLAAVWWDRLSGPRWRRVGVRLGLLGLVQLAAFAVALLAINDYAGLSSSWSQSLGLLTGPLTRHHPHLPPESAAEAAAAVPAQGPATAGSHSDAPTAADRAFATSGKDFRLPEALTPAPDGGTWRTLRWSSPEEWDRRGAVVVARLGSEGLSELTYVYLPPQYFGSRPRRDLPVLEVFTGYPGRTDHLIADMHVPDHALAGIQAGQVAPMVVVMTRPGVTGAWDTECTDVPDGPQALRFYAHRLPAAAVARFGLRSAPWLVLGDSTGGYCAAKIAMSDPTDYGAAVAMSGYFSPATDPSTRGIFDDETLRRHNDLGWLLAHRPVPPISLLLTTGRDDRRRDDGYAVTEEWFGLIRPPIRADELVLDHGGHDFTSFDRDMPFALSWLSVRLPHSHVRQAPRPMPSTLNTRQARCPESHCSA